jgi:hypothetical protein
MIEQPDPLSDVLRSVRLRGSGFFHVSWVRYETAM